MSRLIQIDVDEARRVFDLLEALNEFFHQPLNYQDPHAVELLANKTYPEIKDLYYGVVWKWLPEDLRKEIENG